MRMREILEFIDKRNADGSYMVAQVTPRPAGTLMSLGSSLHPFSTHRSYRRLMEGLTLAQRVERLCDPAVRAEILADTPAVKDEMTLEMVSGFHNHFSLGNPPDYEPLPEKSIQERARRMGKTPQELAYDTLLERNGREVIYMPIGTAKSLSFDGIRPNLLNPATILSLSDGGAHCGLICDAGMPTFMLTYWVRDRQSGDRVPLEAAVKRQTQDTARLYGLLDRGLVKPGMKADVNVIDFDRLQLQPPEMVYDLPANGRRFVQKVDGYRYTVMSGEVSYEDGEHTGAMPGKVIRGPQAA